MELVYKRFLAFIIIPVIIAAFPFLVFASDDENTSYEWYFKPNNTNTRPEVIPEATFINDYDVMYCGSDTDKAIYLTFDAGYDSGEHNAILDTLKQKKVKAAFFVDGNFVKSNPDIIKRMYNEGHLVCNHTKSHPDMTSYSSFEEYSKQITEWEQLIKDLGYKPTKYFRFPSGKFSKQALEYNKQLGLKTVFWSFAYYDWVDDAQPTHEYAKNKIYSRVHNGAILLLHSTSKTNSQILGDVIDDLMGNGYYFETLDNFKA